MFVEGLGAVVFGIYCFRGVGGSGSYKLMEAGGTGLRWLKDLGLSVRCEHSKFIVFRQLRTLKGFRIYSA